MAVAFPGQIVRRNSSDSRSVVAIQQRLVELGCGPLPVNGLFDAGTESAVRMFQARFPDRQGIPLVADGEVGPISWAVLFGTAGMPAITAPGSSLAGEALAKALSQVGVMEKPLGSNRGTEVEQYLRAVGVAPGNAWCAAFTWWCANEAAQAKGMPNLLPRTGGVLEMWRRSKRAGLPCVTADQAVANTALVTAGMIFAMDFGGGLGHMGFVEGFAGGRLVTIEGNSNDDGSRNGTGVFRLQRRTIGSINAGFIGIP
jgi:hypothetical protein